MISASSLVGAPSSKSPTLSKMPRRKAPGKQRVDVALRFRVSKRRASEPERAVERGADGQLHAALRPAARGAADVVGPGAVQHLDALLEVVGSVVGVHVHARDHVATGGADRVIEPGGLDPLRVVDQADAVVLFRETGEDLARSIRAAPVGHEYLDPLARIALGLDTAQAGLDEARFVAAGHRDGDVRLAHGEAAIIASAYEGLMAARHADRHGRSLRGSPFASRRSRLREERSPRPIAMPLVVFRIYNALVNSATVSVKESYTRRGKLLRQVGPVRPLTY